MIEKSKQLFIRAGQCYWDKDCRNAAMCPQTMMPCNILCVFWNLELDTITCKGITIGNLGFTDSEVLI
jgi:hypothetical protein